MDLSKKREDLSREVQECVNQARALAERAVFLRGAIAMLNEQIAEGELVAAAAAKHDADEATQAPPAEDVAA